MPCRDDGFAQDDLIRRLNVATMVACDALAVVDGAGLDHKITMESLEWWREHKKLDEERVRRERAAHQRAAELRALYDKLTPEERKLVGL